MPNDWRSAKKGGRTRSSPWRGLWRHSWGIVRARRVVRKGGKDYSATKNFRNPTKKRFRKSR